jgi:putative oxidoreductase
MLESVVRLYQTLRGAVERIGFIGPLLARLSVGYMFAETGWGKLQSLDQIVNYFTQLGIPYPEFQAPFVAGHEFVCGWLLIAGLATRLAAIPLTIIMMVALATGVEWEGFTGMIVTDEFVYAGVLVWLVVAGPGAASLDALIKRWATGGVDE